MTSNVHRSRQTIDDVEAVNKTSARAGDLGASDMLRNPTIQMLVVVFALASVDLLADVCWIRYGFYGILDSRYFARVWASMFLSQVTIAGFWLALGDAPLYLRLALTVPLTMAVAKTLDWGLAWVGIAERLPNGDWFLIRALSYFAVLLIVLLVLLPLRRLRHWRLTWHAPESAFPIRQLLIRDILLWMIPFGIVLAIYRFEGNLAERSAESTINSLMSLAGCTLVVLMAMLAAFATIRHFQAFMEMMGTAVLVGLAISSIDVYDLVRELESAAAGPLLWQGLFWRGFETSIVVTIILCATAIIAWVHFVILRATGCRLVRPGKVIE